MDPHPHCDMIPSTPCGHGKARSVDRLLAWALLPAMALIGCCSEAPETPTEWRTVSRTELTSAQAKTLANLEEARDELATSLFQELSSAVQADGHAAAVSVCQDKAPGIAARVSQARGLQVGRTSERLRNPGNAAPSWAIDHIGGEAAEHFSVRGEGEMRALFPIMIAPVCLKCHGAPDVLAEGVASVLAERYATDRATGYVKGDLRGWFWLDATPGT